MEEQPDPLAPGCITRLKRALAAIEDAGDRECMARAVTLLKASGRHELMVELLLAQGGVAMLLRERLHVQRMLQKMRCKVCGGVPRYVDAFTRLVPSYYCAKHGGQHHDGLCIAPELEALREIEDAEPEL